MRGGIHSNGFPFTATHSKRFLAIDITSGFGTIVGMIPIPEKPSLLDIPLKRWFPLTLETLLVALLLVVAVVSRFYDLGARTISHDEINHVVPAFSLYSGNGYKYDPMSHGPFQFHIMALSYALFGDNDFTTRIPAAVLSIVALAVALFAFRRYLGRTGALVAGVLIIISPLMLFYGRYARNEAYIVLWGILTIYAILRYLERGEAWALFLFTAVNALHFTDKATSYMFAAEEFLFLAAYFVDRVLRRDWQSGQRRVFFLLGLTFSVLLLAGAAGFYLSNKSVADTTADQARTMVVMVSILAAGGVGTLVWSGVELVRGVGWAGLKMERVADLLVLLGTFILPLLGAVPIKLIGYTPLDYTTMGTVRVVVAAVVLAAIGTALGLWWFGRKWLFHAALFFIPFILLYSTFFTNPQGIIGGLVGALSYWTEQQGVARGGQPAYYYALVMIPMYEFLPALGTMVAAGIATFARLWQSQSGQPFTRHRSDSDLPPVPVAALLVFWSVSSLAIFTYAGEKMPWLTIHIALPMILSSAWAIGWLVDSVPWDRLAVWGFRNWVRITALVFLGFLALLTGRDAFRAAYINYDYPTEYLVYAHAAPDPKVLFGEIEEISIRTTGTTDIVAAYDNNVRYPYWWYMRRYANKIDFDVNPTRDLRQALVIAVSDANQSKLTPVVRQDYSEFDGMRLWWPNMDYWSLKWSTIDSERTMALQKENAGTDKVIPAMNIFGYLEYVWPHIKPFFTDPQVRSAVVQIWLNDDFTEWAALKNSTAYTLTDWGVSDRMHYYIRKDIGSQLWPYGAKSQPLITPVDPYGDITIPVSPDLVLGATGTEAGQFQAPRAVAVAEDGSLYVVDSMNNRIQHLSQDGDLLQMWGTRADVSQGDAPGGTFNEPWGIAIAPDGSIYVADTWNYRIQKFTAEGTFVNMWGFFGQASDAPEAFYGPRGVAVDKEGRVYVADTGNKRIVVFGPNGEYITQFGSPGMGLGQLDEPVGVALDAAGNVYVTDTWNQRVQVFSPAEDGLVFTALAEWLVDGWYGQSVENKPFITVDTIGNVSVTDPELCRLITFSPIGQPIRVWDGCSAGTLLMPSGIASDGSGGLWVTNAGNGTLVHLQSLNP
jgi:predicted membrane-bound mannosyltransferase/DNA-binding beta-propeller fold protein YncE